MVEKEFRVKYSGFTRVKAETLEEARRKIETSKKIEITGLRITNLAESISMSIVKNLGFIAALLILVMYFQMGSLFYQTLLRDAHAVIRSFGVLLFIILLFSLFGFVNKVHYVD